MLYRQIIYKYVSEHNLDLKGWEITIFPTSANSGIKNFMSDDYKINTKIPHGITGKNTCKIYVADKNDYGLIVVANAAVICHELAHAILMNYYSYDNYHVMGLKKPLRNNDKSGNKKGKLLNIWTQEVHDREIENKLRFMTVYYKIKNKWLPMQLRVIDIQDLLL